MKYRIGDRVKINPRSVYYGGANNNPMGVVGIVVESSGDITYNVSVKWDNGTHNNYRGSDLLLEGFGTLRNFKFR